MRTDLADYLTPIGSGTTQATTGALSPEREAALRARLRELQRARRDAAHAIRSYPI